jgi:hypothetical protein
MCGAATRHRTGGKDRTDNTFQLRNPAVLDQALGEVYTAVEGLLK